MWWKNDVFKFLSVLRIFMRHKVPKVHILDIDVPRRVERGMEESIKYSHLLTPEDKAEGPESCCGTFQDAFREYLKGNLCQDSDYVDVMVRLRIANGKAVWVVMNPKGPPNYVKLPEKYKISSRRDLEFP